MELLTRMTLPAHLESAYFVTVFHSHRRARAFSAVFEAGQHPLALELSVALFQPLFPLVSPLPPPAPCFHCPLLPVIPSHCLWYALSFHLSSHHLLASFSLSFLQSPVQSPPISPLILLFSYLLSFYTQDSLDLCCLKSHLAIKMWKRDSPSFHMPEAQHQLRCNCRERLAQWGGIPETAAQALLCPRAGKSPGRDWSRGDGGRVL